MPENRWRFWETFRKVSESNNLSINLEHLKNNLIHAFFSNLQFMLINLELRIHTLFNFDIFLSKDLIDNFAFS